MSIKSTQQIFVFEPCQPKILKPGWVVFEEEGFSVINETSLSKISIIDNIILRKRKIIIPVQYNNIIYVLEDV